MYRVMSNKRLMVLLQTSPYLRNILKSCESAEQLEARVVNTQVLKTICVHDIDWTEVYRLLKEVSL